MLHFLNNYMVKWFQSEPFKFISVKKKKTLTNWDKTARTNHYFILFYPFSSCWEQQDHPWTWFGAPAPAPRCAQRAVDGWVCFLSFPRLNCSYFVFFAKEAAANYFESSFDVDGVYLYSDGFVASLPRLLKLVLRCLMKASPTQFHSHFVSLY